MDKPSFEIQDIATYDLYSVSPSDKSHEVVKHMHKYDYDVAPITRNNKETEYVHIEDIDQISQPIEDCSKDITVENIIRPDLDFEQTLEALSDNSFYFIGDGQGVEAIVTRADLNTKTCRNYLFQRMLNFESIVEEYIYQNLRDDWMELVSDNALEEFDDRYERAAEENIRLGKMEYLRFHDKLLMLHHNEEARDVIGYSDKTHVELQGIVRLRNDVAQGHPIIRGMSEELNIRKRDISDLLALFNQIRDISLLLRDNMEKSYGSQ